MNWSVNLATTVVVRSVVEEKMCPKIKVSFSSHLSRKEVICT